MIDTQACCFFMTLVGVVFYVLGYHTGSEDEKNKQYKEKQKKSERKEQELRRFALNDNICEIKARLAKLEKKKSITTV